MTQTFATRTAIRLTLAVLLALPPGLLVTRRPADGAGVVRMAPVGRGPAALAIDARTARIFVANGDDGTVSLLDAHSDVLLRTISQPTYSLVSDGYFLLVQHERERRFSCPDMF